MRLEMGVHLMRSASLDDAVNHGFEHGFDDFQGLPCRKDTARDAALDVVNLRAGLIHVEASE